MESVAFLTHRLTAWLGRLMPAGRRLDELTAALDDAFAGRNDPITAAACGEIQSLAQRHARHLELHFDASGTATPDSLDRPAPGWPPAGPAPAGGVTAVRRCAGDTCVVTIDALDSLRHAAAPVEAAFTLARDAARVALDLRGNGGGDPATLALVAGHLLGDEARQLSDVIYRDRRRQWWTADRPAGTALTQEAAVLVSNHTYSSAEALAYHLQARGRVVVVGERTRGAADHVTPVRLVPRVRGLLPEAVVVDAVTGTNWEQTGVVPDIECPADDALDAWHQVTRGSAASAG